MTNELLIRALAAGAQPVQRLAPSAVRCARWLALCLGLGVGLTLTLGARADRARAAQEPLFSLELLCRLLLGVLSARSAFQLSVPASSSMGTYGLPLAGGLVWLGLVVAQLPVTGGAAAGSGWACVVRILGLGVPALVVG